MTALATIRSRLCHLPRPSSNLIVFTIKKWIESSGTEWTVSRLKELKLFYLRLLAGGDPRTNNLPFFKKDKDGFPKGPFKVYSDLYRRGKYDLLIKSLQLYTPFFKGGRPSKNQWEKFYGSVLQPPPFDESYLIWLLELNANMPSWPVLPSSTRQLDNFYFKKRKIKKFEKKAWSDTKRCMNPYTGKSDKESSLDQVLALQSLMCFKHFGYGRTNMSEVDKKIGELLKQTTDIPVDIFYPNKDLDYVGTISYIQEPGYKLRAIANPFRIYQLALEPFGDDLFDMLKQIDNDCTFDQYKGVEVTQFMLKLEITCHSIDLSDATNVFPLQFTSKMLKQCENFGNREAEITLWTRLSRAKWLTPEGKKIRWKKGQPLGLYPSFAAFSLSHHFLVRALWNWIGLKFDPFRCNCSSDITDSIPKYIRDFPYIILGDDIVIFDDTLASVYKDAMHRLGCPISESKTFTSGQFAEFAGYQISHNYAINPGKWHVLSDDNFLDILRSLGPKGFNYLRPKQREVAEIISSLPEPVGFGWNPDGIPLEDRIYAYIHLYLDDIFLDLGKSKSFSELLQFYLSRPDKVWARFDHDHDDYVSRVISLYKTTVKYIKPERRHEYFSVVFFAPLSPNGIDKNMADILQQFSVNNRELREELKLFQKGLSNQRSLLSRLRSKLGID